MKAGFAFLECSVRHLAETEIEIKPATRGELNLGARLYSEEKQTIFETRLFTKTRFLAPKTWIPTKISIPRETIRMGLPYILNIDFVKEHEYWFADQGGAAYEHVVKFADNLPSGDVLERVATLEDELVSLRTDIRSLQAQVPRLLNAVSAANAAVSIVGRVKGGLDAEEGRAGAALQKLTYEVQSLWQALDAISQTCDGDRPTAGAIGAAKSNPRGQGNKK